MNENLYEACKLCYKKIGEFPSKQFIYPGYDLKIHEKCELDTSKNTFIRIKMMENRSSIINKIIKTFNIYLPYDIIDIIGEYMNNYEKIEPMTGNPTITSYYISLIED